MMRASDRGTSDGGAFLRSALSDGGLLTFSDAQAWFRGQTEGLRASVHEVGLGELPGWSWRRDPLRLVHRTGRFFTVEGYGLSVSGVPWVSGPSAHEVDQPFIRQPEIGVLGFLTKTLNGTRHFLVQAKMEPGNVRQVQLAPTVQATLSNYTRVHRGSSTPYLEFFLGHRRSRVVVDELQPEQGACFLDKRNRNVVVETEDEVAVGERYCWMTLAHLKAFLRISYALNMDARSVLSCLPVADKTELAKLSRPGREPVDAGGGQVAGYGRALLRSSSPSAPAEHTTSEIERWWAGLRAQAVVERVQRSLDELRGWALDEDRLEPVQSSRPFSVVGVRVEGGDREVPAWSQPMLARRGSGLLGLLTQERSGTLHLLMQCSAEPGCRSPLKLMPTVVCDCVISPGCDRHRFAEWFADPAGPHVRLSTRQSDEGGRLWNFDNRYVVAEVPPEVPFDLPPTYRWLTLAQIGRLRARGDVSVEARNLLACLGPAAR